MQHYINKIKQELKELSSLKKERALDGMPAEFQYVFPLIPMLLHFNQPDLPGYLDGAVSGICYYEPCEKELSLLESAFHFQAKSTTTNHAKISALYSMGSTCSIGQTVTSDLDIWICIEEHLTEQQKEILQQKCYLIEEWAGNYHIKLTLFIVDVDRFRNTHHECLIGESCGSAQHMLLLDEFYRSATLLAGKLLLWYVVPSDFVVNDHQYHSYDEAVSALIESNMIQSNEWVDFGHLKTLTAEEYFGASLWQLYKSIDSPFKAVLKTLLIEVYAWEYPKNHSIAYEVKRLIQKGDTCYHHFDPYYMLLEKISYYLQSIRDEQRLFLVRFCFYLKVNEKLSTSVAYTTWRRQLLEQLVKEWQWDIVTMNHLDNSCKWKIEQVKTVHEVLLQTIMACYRQLLYFVRRNNLDALISPQDLSILTRKLYAAYEVLPGKISVINHNISHNLTEKALTFIHVRNDRVNRAGWYVFNREPVLKSIIGHQYLEYSKSLVKLVGWCYFNGLIDNNTILYNRDNGDFNNDKIMQLVCDLKDYFPITVPTATEESLYSPCEIRHLAIILNLENDPTEQLDFSDNQEGFNTSFLNYGKKEINLIQSIDLLYRNSWNEIRVLNFSGTLGILEALKTLLGRMHKNADLPDSIEIFCYSKHFRNEIKAQMQALMDDCIDLRLSTTQSNLTQFKPLRVDGTSWYLFFERLGVSVHQFDNTIDLYGAVSNNKIQGRALNILDDCHDLPKEIDSIACEGIIQFFFEDVADGFNLYILNEHNQIEIYRNCNGNKKDIVKDVNNFYTVADDRFSFSTSFSINFNLPQFYQILYNSEKEREIIPFN